MSLKLTTTTTTKETTEVKLSPRLQQQLLTRLQEFGRLGAEIRERQARQDAIKAEVDQLFTDSGEGNALFNGADVAGYRVKMVCGVSSKLNKRRLIELGCEPAWLEEATESKPNKPYVRITPPGENTDG